MNYNIPADTEKALREMREVFNVNNNAAVIRKCLALAKVVTDIAEIKDGCISVMSKAGELVTINLAN